MVKSPVRRVFGILFAVLLGGSSFAFSQQTQIQYLSGHGKDDAVLWNFFCTSGAQSGYWTNLPVPSNWELHGFGTLNYFRDLTNAYNERGLYEHEFSVPSEWSGKRLFLVFQGVMTDTSAKLNGQSVGPMHQGGYYQFKYEVTPLINFGETNKLEVAVAKHSANKSIDGAERNADYWMYGGIFRPVYLEAVPGQFIERVAIDADANGKFSMNVFLNGVTNAGVVEAQIQTLNGKNVGRVFRARVSSFGPVEVVNLESHISRPNLWTAETPNVYQVRVRLKDKGEIIHEVQQRFGFRTFEVRDGDGLYLNGKRIVLKGCDRHSFWPDSGRCLSDAVQRLDVETIKDMNMNAVRMSHYPPDAEFLNQCDQLGLYVLDELAGWHHAYDTPIGTNLVHEMVTRDANHPSILFWDNGNEGGFNTNLDKCFGQDDPQQRCVLHPWAPFSGLNTIHYLPYDFAKLACNGIPITFRKTNYIVHADWPGKYIYMPTEFLHGLYDGGAGAGLADTWSLMEQSKYLGGGFIWAYLDEGIKRPDNGEIDVAGDQAPDGIVGPYRQREASFYAIKQIWSPVVILETNLPEVFDGTLTVENHYSFTDARQCKFTWQLRQLIPPNDARSVTALAYPDSLAVIDEGVAKSPSILPGSRGKLRLKLPKKFERFSEAGNNYLALRISDPNGRELWTYVWPLHQQPILSGDVRVTARADNFGTRSGITELKGKDIDAWIKDGELVAVERDGKKFSLNNGPRIAATNSNIQEIYWTLRDDGWLQCNYSYTASGTNDYFGVMFDYPEQLVKGKVWFGDGPYRIWKNRRQGVVPSLWVNNYNNTITGWRDWVYPEFKGCFADVRWMQLETTEGQITIVPQHIPFVQVLTPEFPPARLAGHTIPPLPKCGLAFLHAIPPIGSKFQEPQIVSPSGARTTAHGVYSGSVSFYFGDLP
jgi:hypothetical protein